MDNIKNPYLVFAFTLLIAVHYGRKLLAIIQTGDTWRIALYAIAVLAFLLFAILVFFKNIRSKRK